MLKVVNGSEANVPQLISLDAHSITEHCLLMTSY